MNRLFRAASLLILTMSLMACGITGGVKPQTPDQIAFTAYATYLVVVKDIRSLLFIDVISPDEAENFLNELKPYKETLALAKDLAVNKKIIPDDLLGKVNLAQSILTTIQRKLEAKRKVNGTTNSNTVPERSAHLRGKWSRGSTALGNYYREVSINWAGYSSRSMERVAC